MGKADYYAEGDWNIACSMCGRKRKASMMEKNWQGFWRCPEHNEPRHPQDFVGATQDYQTAPFVQHQSDIDIHFCSFNGQSAIAGIAVAGCSIAGRTTLIDPTIIGLPLPRRITVDETDITVDSDTITVDNSAIY